MKFKIRKYWEEEVLEKFVKKVKEFTGIKRDYSKKFFVVFILKKIENKDE